jgi:hypothetical protein
MLDIKAAVRACQLRFVLLEVEEPCAETLRVWSACWVPGAYLRLRLRRRLTV